MKNSSFIRDLLVKVLLVVIFIFLLMYLFPMPNLKPFYSSIFNNNIQTMKDAAEDYYTTERMPSEEGKSNKMTLQEMIDKKLIIPFVDKDGKSCDTRKSYVQVTKGKTEYELKVSLTCGKDSDYIIEKIGCYNFCPTGNCTLAEAKKAQETTPSVTTKTDKDGNVTVVTPSGKYVIEYEYKKNMSSESWKLGDWKNTTEKESADVKLVDKRIQYTGQKKVTSGTTLYEQVSYDYKDNWTYDKDWTTSTTCKGNCSLWKERTLYTGQKKVETKTTEYKHEKYDTKDNWTYDQNWSTDTKTTSDTVKLWKERTLYTGQKKITTGTTEYKHVKYGSKDNWTYDNDWTTSSTCQGNCTLWKERTLYTGQKKIETKTTEYKHVKYNTKYEWNKTDWTTTKRGETNDIKLVDTRYTVRKTVNKTSNTCDNWTLDTTWYSSKPANTSTRVYADSPANTQTGTNWKVVKDSFKSYSALSTYQGDYWYEFLYSNDEKCLAACNGKSKVTVYYYRVYQKSGSTKYQYKYCTPKTTTSTSTDEKVVSASEVNSYTAMGYSIIKTEFRYNVRNTIKYVEDTKWTNSSVAPSGYEYTGQSSTNTTVRYEQLDKWVTSKEALGEYTSNIKTVKQYKYAHNNPTKYIVDIKWTTSKTSPSGYEFTGETATNTKVRYEQLDKWVTSKEALGEYIYNVKTVKQYKYAYNKPTRYLVDVKWTNSKVSPAGYEYTGKTATHTVVKYEQLNKWVTSTSDLGEYTYNIKTAKQYKYKYNDRTKYIKDTIWTTENVARSGYELTGKTKTTSKTTYVDLGRWVNSKSELGEYTYNIKTRTQYRYKYRTIVTSYDIIWARTNPGNGYEPTGNSRKYYVPDNTVRNRQK